MLFYGALMKTSFGSTLTCVALFVLCSHASVSAQSFEITAFEPTPMPGAPSTHIEHHGTLLNASATEKTVAIRYFMGGAALGHFASLCIDIGCYYLPNEPFGTFDLPEFVLAAGSTIELKSILSATGTEGMSTLDFLIAVKKNPADTLRYVVQFDVRTPTAVAEAASMVNLHVAPNPTSGYFTIAGSSACAIRSVTMYDLNGTLVYNAEHDGSNSLTTDVHTLPPGIYRAVCKTLNADIFTAQIAVLR